MIMLLLNALLFLAGFLIMIRGAEAFVEYVAKLGRRLGAKPVIVGLVAIAFGTSMPELFLSTIGAMRGSSEISVGNVVGSNIANIGLFLGFAGFITVQSTKKSIFTKETPVMIGSTLMLYILMLNGIISKLDGLILLGVFAFYIWWVFKTGMHNPDDPALQEMISETKSKKSVLKLCVLSFLGLGGLLLGSTIIVDTGIEMAKIFRISESIIALTAMALGTSIPEITSSIVALKNNELELAYGGIIGSITFNSLLIIGVSSFVTELSATKTLITDALIMVCFAVIMLPFTLAGWKLNKWKSSTILVMYSAFVVYAFFR